MRSEQCSHSIRSILITNLRDIKLIDYIISTWDIISLVICFSHFPGTGRKINDELTVVCAVLDTRQRCTGALVYDSIALDSCLLQWSLFNSLIVSLFSVMKNLIAWNAERLKKTCFLIGMNCFHNIYSWNFHTILFVREQVRYS